MSKRNQHQQLQKGTIQTKEKKDGRKGHVDEPKQDGDDFEKHKDKLKDETQSYKYSQSSKFSDNARKLVLGILATIWLFMYSDNEPSDIVWQLFVSLVLCIVYLTIDIFQYFLDTISYHKELNRFDKYRCKKDIEQMHETKMNAIAKRSFRYIEIKFVILVTLVVFFIIGFSITYFCK